ncbi:hypothetical protein [Ruminococcus sp.]|uniref:hypothetical protein n=1 Tax=Ruminococcus sp. TaxID=41978 RepID=UPI001B726841|nr:hypothetical protein [Ruminococcus sp.]MBP5431125.1 hypothetical protein [Ruminococcus sp.]
MKRTKSKLTLFFMLAVFTLTGCGKTGSDKQNDGSKNDTTVTTASETISATVTAGIENTEVAVTQTATDDVSASDYSVSDLVGEWVQEDIGNMLTVNDDGSCSVKYRYGGTRYGTIKIDTKEQLDGSKKYMYSFYQPDDTLWAEFACPEKPFDMICSDNEGGMTFHRNITGKPFAPFVPEAMDIRDALAFADCLMSGSGVETDTNAEYITYDGTVYHKSTNSLYRTTADVYDYLRIRMTEEFLNSRYDSLFGTEHPKCIDVNGELYIEYRPVGGRYSFSDDNPVITESETNADGYSIKIKNNNYGAEETVTVEVVKEDGKWKITDVSDNF